MGIIHVVKISICVFYLGTTSHFAKGEYKLDKDGRLVDVDISPYESCDGHSSCKRWWWEWSRWSFCTHTCGGGTRTRTGQRWCKCDSWRHGDVRCTNIPPITETEGCQEWCQPGRGVFQQGVGCQCGDIYYDYCCASDCPKIKWCDKYWCNAPPSTCTQCDAYAGPDMAKQAYWLNQNQCWPRCNWLDHWCFPGRCDTNNEYLATTCQCDPGFKKITPNEMTTKCELEHPPKIETCRSGIEDDMGNVFNSTFDGPTTGCDHTIDTYVNIKPDELFLAFDFSFHLPQDPPNETERHAYIHDFHFGIVSSAVSLKHYQKSGSQTTLRTLNMATEAVCNNNSFTQQDPVSGLISCLMTYDYTYNDVIDGEKICQRFEPVGSGFVRIKNMVNQNVGSKQLYAQTKSNAEKCFRFDFVEADHCGNNNPPCSESPLDVGPRIQNHSAIHAKYFGYFDPDPQSQVTGPSGIHKYTIDVHTMQHDYGDKTMKVNMKVEETFNATADIEELSFDLPEREEPMMYCLLLTTLDLAGNYRMARRFVIFDNSSELKLDDENPLRPITASPSTGWKWQVSLDHIVVDWKEHFYNDWHKHTNLLWPIRPDDKVVGIFDQIDEPLPVTGTPNVHGIIEFQYTFHKTSPSGNQTAAYRPIQTVTDEQVTLDDLPIEDGDIVDVTIKAIDVMQHTITNSFTMYIDSSPPVLQNLWLTKDGYKQLYVHNSKDLSTMEFVFEGLDPHSGLKQVYWRLGTSPQGSEIGHGALPVVRINGTGTCEDPVACYCPILDRCSYLNYTIELNHIIASNTSDGNHNREYHFWVEIINHAELATIEEVTILVDDSPPETGVVLNGPEGSEHVDFQSDALLHWHWRGFIDHESGISKYHYAVGEHCFTKEELQFLEQLANNTEVLTFDETTNLHAEYLSLLPANYHVSVIAFNNAMDPSEVVCSSSILVDNTPPVIKHLKMSTARTQPSIACTESETIWLVTSQMVAQPLLYDPVCEQHCSELKNISILYFDIRRNNNGSIIYPPVEESRSLCAYLPTYQVDQDVFIPTDNVEMRWDSEEPESQIHDFFLGVSTSKDNILSPDIIDYKSMRNHTHYKCVHCGLGEGDRFFLQVKAVNKPGLEAVASVGPITIDLTPPIYVSGLTLETGNVFNLSWPAVAFIDTEDTQLLAEYQWALGTKTNPQEVENWTPLRIPHTDIDQSYVFHVQYPSEKLEAHDQNQGKTYIFSVKAFNRAGLSTHISTDPYTMHSQTLPTVGKIFHVDKSNIGEDHVDEIGFQEDMSTLCAKWNGISHPENELELSLGVGSRPGDDDVVPKTSVSNSGGHCFEQLNLHPVSPYYFVLSAFNVKGSVELLSKGILVSSEADALLLAKVNDGLGCSGNFDVIGQSIYLGGNYSTQFEYSMPGELTSKLRYSITITYEWNSDFAPLSISANNEPLSRYTYEFKDEKITEHYMIYMMKANQTFLIELQPSSMPLLLDIIAIQPCIKDQNIQSSTKGLKTSWTFRPEVLSMVTHYEVGVTEHQCSATGCQDGGQIMEYSPVGLETSLHLHNLILTDGLSYEMLVRPCFGPTCISSKSSEGILVDTTPAVNGEISCVIKPNNNFTSIGDIIGDRIFEIDVSWDAFTSSKYGLRNGWLEAYDWTLGLNPTGGAVLMPWDRVRLRTGEQELKVKTAFPLHMYERKTVYLLVRTYDEGYMQSLVSQVCEVEDAKASLGAPVYDLPMDYEDLDTLKDFLHSNQLGWVARKLHDDELDFSANTRGISGALQGTDCDDHEWWLQTDVSTNCKDLKSHDHCIRKKSTTENIVQFKNMVLSHGSKYFICVHGFGGKCTTSFKACSNGFIIDTKPPMGGKVFVGQNFNEPVHSDNTSVLIHWEGFSDLEEEIEIPYAAGIKEYFYAIGSSPGDVDTVNWTSVGVSTHAFAAGLSLTSGHLYYMSVKACDHVDLCTVVSSMPTMVDATPPTPGSVIVKVFNHELSSSEEDMVVNWENFQDKESGLKGYELGIGSLPTIQDAIPFGPVNGLVTFVNGNDKLRDGHNYYFQIKAINRVGLWTVVSSQPVLYDSTPPTAGYVRFGDAATSANERYTRDVTRIRAYWGGFSDPHSGVMYYRFCVGSSAGLCDVTSWEDVGLQTAISVLLDLAPGTLYYVTVEACNRALRCVRVSSAPLVADNSPPMPGLVRVGFSEDHSMYHSSVKSIQARWLNFHDPESGIKNYVWCIGTRQDNCDIMPQTDAHQSHVQFATNLSLPIATPLFVNLVVTNNVDLTITGSSPQFIVDITPPQLLSSPVLSPSHSLISNTQFDRSVVSLEWQFDDHESPIWTHTVSLHTHHNGQVPLDRAIVGAVHKLTRSLSPKEQLKDGNVYVASVTACNAAGLCTLAETPETLIDSSPPHLGGFVEPMFWSNDGSSSQVTLTWEGFDDAHSGIAFYHIMLSTTYNGNDLSEGVLKVAHNSSLKTQQETFALSKNIPTYTMVYLSIWAENGVGLLSDAAKVGVFTLLSGPNQGKLDIEKHSCDVHYCSLDCACAVVNRVCDAGEIIPDCNEIVQDHLIKVHDGPLGAPQTITSSTTCLRGFWENLNQSHPISRYEWTVGGKDAEPGTPIFDIINEKYWFDVELYNQAIYCLPGNSSLQHGLDFVFFVKAWHSFDDYTIVSSQGILIDSTPPRIGMGRAVKIMDSSFENEIAFTTDMHVLNVHWDRVFTDAETGIDHYEVSVGTTQGGNEIHGPDNLGLATNTTFSGLTLIPGFHYYVTVSAYNPLGMVETMASKSVVVDIDPPIPGIVHSSTTFKDAAHHIEEVSASWNGFEDLHSFIKFYEWAISKGNASTDSLEFTSSNFETSMKMNALQEGLEDGVAYYIHVRATDAAGHVSPVITSNPIILDHSPPQGQICQSFSPVSGDWGLTCSPCNSTGCSTDYKTCAAGSRLHLEKSQFYRVVISTNNALADIQARLKIGKWWDWIDFVRESHDKFVHTSTVLSEQDEDVVPTVYVFKGEMPDISVTVHICNSIMQTDKPLSVKQIGPVGLNLHWGISDSESGIKSFQIGMGTNHGGFQLQTLHDIGQSSTITIPSKLQHRMKVHAVIVVENNAGLRSVFYADPLTIDWTPPRIENLVISTEASGGDLYEIMATWELVEEETTSQDCHWALGLAPGGEDLMTSTLTDSLNRTTVGGIQLHHGDTVYATISCTNSLGLTDSVTSDGVLIVSRAPRADSAYTVFHPQSHTEFSSRDATQASADTLEFEFHGFEDVIGIEGYEYRISSMNQWESSPLTDHLVIGSLALQNPQLYNISVRAINAGGFKSAEHTALAKVQQAKPQWSGKKVTFDLTDRTVTLTWQDVFSWSSDKGQLAYVVHVGSEVGSANVITGLETLETSLTVTSKLWKPPGECFVVLTAVAPSGEYVTYRETINY